MSNLNKLLYALIILVSTAFFYAPSFTAEFVWDDGGVFAQQVPFYKSPMDAIKPDTTTVGASSAYFRPMVVWTYMVQHKLNNALYGDVGLDSAKLKSEKRAVIPHAFAVFVHCANSILVMALIWGLLKGRKDAGLLGLFGGLLFATHPVHAESVAFASGISDTLATFFVLISALCAVKLAQTGKAAFAIAIGAGFLFALLSKEVALCGLVLFPLLYYFAKAEEKADAKSIFIPVGVAFAAYLALRSLSPVTFANRLKDVGGGFFADLFKALGFYVRKLVFPWPNSPYIPELPGGLETAIFLLVGVALVFFAILWYKRGQKFYVFCVLWFFASLAPSLGTILYRISETTVAERYLYLPSVALCLAAPMALANVKLRTAGIATLVVTLAFGFSSYMAAKNYSTNINLWSYVVRDQTAAKYALPWGNLAAASLGKGDGEAAEKYFAKALEPGMVIDDEGTALANGGIGMIYLGRAQADFNTAPVGETRRRLQTALTHLQKSVDLHPRNWVIMKNLAQAKMFLSETVNRETGKYDKLYLLSARQDIIAAKILSPTNPILDQLLGIIDNSLKNSR